MLPSLKVKSIEHCSALGRPSWFGWLRFGQPTRHLKTNSRFRLWIGAVAFSFSDFATAQTPAQRTDQVELAPNVRIEIVRGIANAECPKASEIRDALLANRVNSVPTTLTFSVEFAHKPQATIATIRVSGARSGTRELHVMTQNCRALLEPLAVSLSLLMDPDTLPAGTAAPGASPTAAAGAAPSDPSRPSDDLPKIHAENGQESATSHQPLSRGPNQQRSDPQPAPNREPNQEPSQNSSRSLERPRRDRGLGAGFGPALVMGLVPNHTYGFELQLGAHFGAVSLHLAATDCAADEQTIGNGRVRGHSTFGRLGLCARLQQYGPLSLSICQSTWLGQLSVQGLGFGANRASAPWFVALGGLFDLTWIAYGPLGVYLRAGLFAPFTRHHFAVDGFSESALASQAVGGSVGSGIHWKFL